MRISRGVVVPDSDLSTDGGYRNVIPRRYWSIRSSIGPYVIIEIGAVDGVAFVAIHWNLGGGQSRKRLGLQFVGGDGVGSGGASDFLSRYIHAGMPVAAILHVLSLQYQSGNPCPQ